MFTQRLNYFLYLANSLTPHYPPFPSFQNTIEFLHPQNFLFLINPNFYFKNKIYYFQERKKK